MRKEHCASTEAAKMFCGVELDFLEEVEDVVDPFPFWASGRYRDSHVSLCSLQVTAPPFSFPFLPLHFELFNLARVSKPKQHIERKRTSFSA
jgi:hypothetical protein